MGLPNWNDFLQNYKDWLKRTEMEMPRKLLYLSMFYFKKEQDFAAGLTIG
jgi:hypothetical protein